jgi:hypothetical protein
MKTFYAVRRRLVAQSSLQKHTLAMAAGSPFWQTKAGTAATATATAKLA